MFTRFVVPAAIIVLAGIAGAAETSIEVVVPEATVTVGDHVEVRVVARGGEGWLWGELQIETTAGGPWEIVDGPRAITGSRPPAWRVVLAPMVVGDEPVPGFSVTARSPDGERRAITSTETPTVKIASVLPPDGRADPAPLRDPLGVQGFPWEWVVPILMAVIPALLAQRWWLRRRRGATAEDIDTSLSPIDELEVLAGALAEDLGRVPSAAVCDRLAGGFRRYLERRTGEPALEMTSFELRRLARSEDWPEPVQRGLHRVMRVVDEVRFGQRTVAEAELRRAVEVALDAGRGLESSLAAPQELIEVAS